MPARQTAESSNLVADKSPWLGYIQLGYEPPAEKLVQGKDYWGRIYSMDETYPNQTAISWSLPDRVTASGKPWGFLHLANGAYEYAKPRLVLPAKKVVDLLSWRLNVVSKLTLLGGSAAVLWDTYLTSSADPVAKVGELGVFLHTSPEAWSFMTGPQCKPIRGGVFKHPNGMTFAAYIPANGVRYYMFAPVDYVGASLMRTPIDILSTDLDLKPFMDFLMGSGLVDASTWTTGTAIGVEPAKGAGVWSVDSITVTQS